jgi:hypothetical protein
MSSFDFESLTLEEVETIEGLTNSSIDEAFIGGKPKGKALTAFVWVVLKRNNPSFKIEDARKLSLKEALDMVKGDDSKKE